MGGYADLVNKSLKLEDQDAPAAAPVGSYADIVQRGVGNTDAALPSAPGGSYADIVNSGLTQPSATPSAKEQLRESTPWWYRAITFGAGALEPFMLPGDLLRSALFDLTVRKRGERSEFLETLNQLAVYAPWGAAPKRVAPGEEIVKRAFGAEGTAASVSGFLVEALVDPFVFADVVGTSLVRGAEKGLGRIAADVGKKVGRELRPDDLLRAADEFEAIGDETMAEIARLSAQKAFGQKLRSPALFIPEPARVAVGKTLVNILDKIPSPFAVEYIGEQGLYKHGLSVAEATLTPQALMAAYAGTPMEEALRRLYGHADVTDIARGEAKATPALLDRAKQKALHFNALALEAIKSVPETFEKFTGLKPSQNAKAYDLWSKSTAELLDSLLSGPKLAREVIETGKPPNVNDLLDFSRGQTEYYERLKKIAKQYGVDEDALFKAGIETAKRQLEITTWLGWTLSGMDDYNKLLDKVAKRMEVDRSELAVAVWKKAFDKELDETEEKLFSALADAWGKDPIMRFYSVNPLTYLKNVSDGYFRRVMGINIQDEGFMRAFLQTARAGTKWIPAMDLRADEFTSALERVANKEAADKVADFLFAYGDGTISPEMIEHYTGVSADDVVKALKEVQYRDVGPDLRRKIERALEGGTYAGKKPAASLIGKVLFQSRKVPEEELAAWLPLARLEERAAGMAAAGRRAIAGQEILRTMWNELGRLGLLASDPADLKRLGVKNAVQIPNKEIYGPLAGKYIPRYFADQILRAVSTGDRGYYQRMLNNLRVMWLASPTTIARNISGGITAMHAGGLTPQEIVTYGAKAAHDIRQVMKTQDLRTLGPGWEQLKLYGEGEMAAEAGDRLLQGLEDIMRKAGKPTTQFQEAVDRWGKTAANLASGRPMFGVFQLSEDTMRVTTFYALRDRFIKQGIDKNTAGALAAQYANNILFDYSNQPHMVRWLKRWGLALFPSFPYFNLSRTATLIGRRPVTISTMARVASASDQFLPEEDRQTAGLIVNSLWLRDQAPILIPTGERGRFVAVPIKYMFPQLAGADFFTDGLGEIAAGGVFQSLIDASAALTTGEGKGPFGARYGKEVFSPALDRTPAERGLKTVGYLAQGYMPGHLRWGSNIAANLLKHYRANNPELLLKAYADEYGYGPAKALAKTLGFNIRELGPADFIESKDRLEYQYERKQRELRRKVQEAIRAGDQQTAMRYYQEQLELYKEHAQQLCELFGGHWKDGRCQ